MRKQSLSSRFNARSVDFFKRLLHAAIGVHLAECYSPAFLCSFKKLKITDGTSFQLPARLASAYKGHGGGASKSGIKTHFQIELCNTGQELGLEVTDSVNSDFACSLITPEPGELHLFDLGYFSLQLIKQFDPVGAFFLARLRFSTVVWSQQTNGLQRIDWGKLNKKMKVGQTIEKAVLLGADQAINARLIVRKLPAEIAQKRRRNLLSHPVNKRKKVSEPRLQFCDLEVMVTNTTNSQIATEQISQVYAIRWQIEIWFKAWKSYMNIDKVHQMSAHRFTTTHYATLIFIVITTKLFNVLKYKQWNDKQLELSELKAARIMANNPNLLWDMLIEKPPCAKAAWRQLKESIYKYARKEKKKGKKLPFMILQRALN